MGATLYARVVLIRGISEARRQRPSLELDEWKLKSDFPPLKLQSKLQLEVSYVC